MRIERNTNNVYGIFTFFMLIIAFVYMFSVSGYAESVRFNAILTICFGVIILWKTVAIKQIKKFSLFGIIVAFAMFTAVLFHFQKVEQITNFVTLFCGGIFVDFFSKMKWNEKRLITVGICGSFLSLIMLLFLLPGGIWSGWNANSSAIVVPIFMWSCSCILNTSKKWKNKIMVLLFCMMFYLLFVLENRSGIMTLVLFAFLLITKGGINKIRPFRLVYIAILLINIGFPYLRNQLSSNKIIRIIQDFFVGTINKGEGFNGREQLWADAIEIIAKNPFCGKFGIRPAYYHNFSIEVLVQFGCIGLLFFEVFFVLHLEKGFRKNSASNYFLSATVCMLFLNTFENLFLCNNYFMFFPYVMLGTAFAVRKSYEDVKQNVN